MRTLDHRNNVLVPLEEEGVFLANHAFKKNIVTYRIMVPNVDISIVEFLAYAKPKVHSVLASKLVDFINLKFNCELFGQFHNVVTGDECTKSFNTKTQTLTNLEEAYDELWETLASRIVERYQDFQMKDSGMFCFFFF